MASRSSTASDGNGITQDGAAEIASVLKLKCSNLAWLSMVNGAAAFYQLLTRITFCRGEMRLETREASRLQRPLVAPFI
jgi:hypothetical protein